MTMNLKKISKILPAYPPRVGATHPKDTGIGGVVPSRQVVGSLLMTLQAGKATLQKGLSNAPGANVKKLFRPKFTNFRNKLEFFCSWHTLLSYSNKHSSLVRKFVNY